MTTTDPLEQNSLALRAMSNDRLLADFVGQIESDLHRNRLDASPTTVAMRMEILRRMTK